MSSYAEVGFIITINNNQEKELLKSGLQELLFNALNDTDQEGTLMEILKNMKKMINSEYTQFCYFDECIGYSYIEETLDSIINIIKHINKENENIKCNIQYELIELCTEYLEVEHIHNTNSHNRNFYISTTVSNLLEFDEENQINILEWLCLENQNQN